MKFALLQLNFLVGDLHGNCAKIFEGIEAQKNSGVDLFLTSELSLTGYPPKDLLMNSAFVARCQQKLESFALELKGCPAVLIGAPEAHASQQGKGLYNSCFLLFEGKVQVVARKQLLPNYDVFDELRYFDSSPTCEPFMFQGCRLGVSICEDIWNDSKEGKALYSVNPIQSLRDQGVDVMVNLSSSPFSIGKQAHREKMLHAAALKSKCPLIYVNQFGGNDDLIFDGRSAIYDPHGSCLMQAQMFAEDLLLYELGNTTQQEYSSPEMEEEVYSALVLGLRDYMHKVGFQKAVLGLSGGIDSALTAALAVAALGKENVTGLMMPSPYSSQGSLDDSVDLAERLEIQIHTFPIAPLMQSFQSTLSTVLEGVEGSLTEENLQARIRGNLLMSYSNHSGAMLLSTGNKSELSVGYCTIYGDMAGGLAVISDLPKTLVYSLCRWINKNKGDVIPVNIITKPPSAELRPDQLDQDSLPEYDILDAILKLHIEDHQSLEEIIAQGFAEEDVKQVVRLVAIAEFKRKQAAPGLKMTDQAFGSGWRMPIVAKRF